VGYSSSTLPYLLALTGPPRAMDLVDVDSAKWARYADHARGPKRWLYAREARTVKELERRSVAACDAVFLVSQAEADQLPLSGDNVQPVGNGVDLDYFAPPKEPASSSGLVFTGTMDYAPNVDGVCWFAEHVWPAVRLRWPDLTFTIVGRDPAKAVRRLAERDGIEVTGAVPDVRPYVANSAVAVCPLRIARGIQNKILEAMAMARPVVASPQAAQGLAVTGGEHLLIAETPREWASSVLALLADTQEQRRLGRAGRTCVETRYTWEGQLATLVDTCSELLARRPARPASPRPVDAFAGEGEAVR
jgi:sugar transferase (PEP-CTERM/EpsH1 system associated)